jgi:HemY protein
MIRVAVFFALLALAALGLAWFADRPGQVVLTWQGWQITTSLMVAAVAFFALFAVTLFAWSILRFFLRSPQRVAHYFEERRQLRGWRAISRGLIAVGTGNAQLALQSSTEAKKLLAAEPLALLLSAQAAQLNGDSKSAENDFRTMLAHDQTKLLGLHGLFVEAQRRNDPVAALGFAEEAAKADPALGWAGDAVLEFRCRGGDWSGALDALQRQVDAKAISKQLGKRRRAVLLTAQALAFEDRETSRARELAAQAVKLAPDLMPAVALSARLEAQDGNVRRASKMIERAFAKSPHPELADAYADLRPGDGARERLERMQSLTRKAPGHPESVMAVARAAIDASDFKLAREGLTPLLDHPTQRVCLLMAEIESAEHGDHGKAREWTARAVRAQRDPAWVADGYVSERWLPISPVSGRLDAFVWAVPPETFGGPLLEQVTQQALAVTKPEPAPAPAPKKAPPIAAPVSSAPARKREEPPRRKATAVVAEPPLPDDPGPELDGEAPSGRASFKLFSW